MYYNQQFFFVFFFVRDHVQKNKNVLNIVLTGNDSICALRKEKRRMWRNQNVFPEI